ncbi:hypothetical protein NE236_07815 [Actinoallomurus purpureus]|uniref:hypothetical protein n=1 Tax=Actinoallomurus purpureus TaxID=478114 RepID=UPI002093D365|nr:hypothetical protein [Actinoallomurus purpureus]MCO6004884.1 hypothetical protein [Actinoallomurus purpureus]
MKKTFKWGGLAFLAFYLISRPHSAANVVHGALGGISGAANSLSTFVSDLPNK